MQNLPENKKEMHLNVVDIVRNFFKNRFAHVSAETIGWVAILLLHGATIPGLIALMTGLTDSTPPVDVVLMLWAGLLMFLAKAAIQKDLLNMMTIGLGFMIQAVLLILIFFK